MDYTIIVNNESYDLPKKTVKVMEELESVLKVDSLKNLSLKQKYEKLHDFVKKVLGEGNAQELLEAGDIQEIDLSELVLAVNKINDAYKKPIDDYESAKRMAEFDKIPMEKIVAMTKAANTMSSIPQRK